MPPISLSQKSELNYLLFPNNALSSLNDMFPLLSLSISLNKSSTLYLDKIVAELKDAIMNSE